MIEIAQIGRVMVGRPEVRYNETRMIRRALHAIAWAIRRLGGRKPDPPDDPDSRVRAPLRRGPAGRSSAAVLELPKDPQLP